VDCSRPPGRQAQEEGEEMEIGKEALNLWVSQKALLDGLKQADKAIRKFLDGTVIVIEFEREEEGINANNRPNQGKSTTRQV
jgi:hypothetical protein